MLENLVQLDKRLFVFLNGLGSENYDGLWLFITKQTHWTPVFLFVFYLLYKKIGGKNLLVVLISIAVLITFTDQFTNLVKYLVQRLRPCNDPQIKSVIRIVKTSDTFSFFSGHAANSMASTVFIFSILRKHYKYAFLLFLFPLIFAYSRIYLGLHFPGDILTGYVVGIIFGFFLYRLYGIVHEKYFAE